MTQAKFLFIPFKSIRNSKLYLYPCPPFWYIRKPFLPCCTTGRPVIRSVMAQIQKIYSGTLPTSNLPVHCHPPAPSPPAILAYLRCVHLLQSIITSPSLLPPGITIRDRRVFVQNSSLLCAWLGKVETFQNRICNSKKDSARNENKMYILWRNESSYLWRYKSFSSKLRKTLQEYFEN